MENRIHGRWIEWFAWTAYRPALPGVTEPNGVLDPPPNHHNILTGSQFDGTAFPPGVDRTCSNWTNGGDTGSAQGGHHDRTGVYTSWNLAHPSKSCSQAALVADGGYGAVYCFAID